MVMKPGTSCFRLRLLLLLFALSVSWGTLHAQEHTKAFRQGLKELRKSPPDFKKAYSLFVQAADEGDADAHYHIGQRFEWGEVTVKSYDSAISHYLKGSKQNSSLCMVGLGKVYYRYGPLRELAFYSFPGSDKKYDSLSLYWYQKAALLDNAEALNYFANNAENDTLAYYYAQRSAATGDCEGMKRLADCFRGGRGTAIDVDEAKHWYKMAIKYASFNYTEAKDALDALNGKKKNYEYGVLDYRKYGFSADTKEQRLPKQERSATLSEETRQYNEWWQKTYGNRGTSGTSGGSNTGSSSNNSAKEQEQHRRNMDEIQRSIERQQNRDYNRKNR